MTCLLLLSLSSLSFTASSCQSIQISDKEVCSVTGKLSAGGTCTHTLSDEIHYKTFEQYIDWLSAKPERPDPDHEGQKLPPHGAALCMSANDWAAMKTELETACRLLGKNCSWAMKQTIAKLDLAIALN